MLVSIDGPIPASAAVPFYEVPPGTPAHCMLPLPGVGQANVRAPGVAPCGGFSDGLPVSVEDFQHVFPSQNLNLVELFGRTFDGRGILASLRWDPSVRSCEEDGLDCTYPNASYVVQLDDLVYVGYGSLLDISNDGGFSYFSDARSGDTFVRGYMDGIWEFRGLIGNVLTEQFYPPAASVPEPATAGLFGCAMLLFAVLARAGVRTTTRGSQHA